MDDHKTESNKVQKFVHISTNLKKRQRTVSSKYGRKFANRKRTKGHKNDIISYFNLTDKKLNLKMKQQLIQTIFLKNGSKQNNRSKQERQYLIRR